MNKPVHIVGAGLAGSECAYQLAHRGIPVVLHEMRPTKTTPAHHTDHFAELVCSNSLRSDDPLHAAGLLKREMEAFGSLIIGAARKAAVPAGSALAVDRDLFAADITQTLREHPLIEIRLEEVTDLPEEDTVLATGPLTSEALSKCLLDLLGSEHLYFYDAIAPIVEAESLDMEKIFAGSRYGKGDGDDYLNAPMTREQYLEFHTALVAAEEVEAKSFEDTKFFEGCLPIEEMARRGVDTLCYGPLKPVGLHPPDGSRPHAVVQLRQENLARSQYNLVGFQSRLKWGEQKRILRMIPGLEGVKFVRLGQIHRNTFINAPIHLDPLFRVKKRPSLRLAGQITGVEGYLESAATGLAIALFLSLERQGKDPEPFPATTAFGAMVRHLIESEPKRFQPANINYGLFTPLERRMKKAERRGAYAARANRELVEWAGRQGLPLQEDSLPEKEPASEASTVGQ
ncbi:MAG: methylenetetrahydrofolate--tRNA-(uracil(54)-C(5))-methyltransferase (FADH(2)-oxidizing) TrmFO [Deltaproteobacteria bacterium]|nr:methylenetetrahydrofolate--tRNA-(uracil(54)-C(5))-methyltransferase (FADH(2)-oxidizing) TrmFO [Deltaproteobacteria bacterium]